MGCSMGKGSYHGGSTVIHPGSSWFGRGSSESQPRSLAVASSPAQSKKNLNKRVSTFTVKRKKIPIEKKIIIKENDINKIKRKIILSKNIIKNLKLNLNDAISGQDIYELMRQSGEIFDSKFTTREKYINNIKLKIKNERNRLKALHANLKMNIFEVRQMKNEIYRKITTAKMEK